MKLKHICFLFILLSAGIMSLSFHESRQFLQETASDSEVILRMAVPYEDTHPSSQTAFYFADLVKSRTQERIQIEVHTNAHLGNEQSTIEQLKFGGLAFSILSTLALPDHAAVLQSTDSLPPQLLPDQSALDLMQLKVLTIYTPDLRCVANNKYPLSQTPAEQGRSQRRLSIQAHASDPLRTYLHSLGFLVIQPSENDLAASLNYGYIDGAELALMEYVTADYSDILPYLSITDGIAAPDVILSSNVSMGNLSSEDQEIIKRCAEKSTVYQTELLSERQAKAVEKLLPSYFTTMEGNTYNEK